MSKELPKKFFVYGTLKPGGRFWPQIESMVARIEKASIRGYQMYDLGAFPALLPDPQAENPVQGLLLTAKSGMEMHLAQEIAWIEQGLYEPQSVPVEIDGQPAGEAVVYLWSGRMILDPSRKILANSWTGSSSPFQGVQDVEEEADWDDEGEEDFDWFEDEEE